MGEGHNLTAGLYISNTKTAFHVKRKQCLTTMYILIWDTI